MFTTSPQVNRSIFPVYGSTRKGAQTTVFRFIIDLCLYLIIIMLCRLMAEQNLHVYRRGFYCDDNSIRYPLQKQTISTSTFFLIITIMSLLTFAVVELFYKNGNWKGYTNKWPQKRNVYDLLIRFLLFADCCLFVLLMDYLLTILAKYAFGRLRPHFLTVCLPLLDLKACEKQHVYIANYTCVGGESSTVTRARLSFFSGHASMSFAVATFCAFYVQANLRRSISVTLGKEMHLEVPFRVILQMILFFIPVLVAISRVIDHFHFISDVVVGALVGTSVATVTAFFVAQLFCKSFESPADETSPLVELPRTSTPDIEKNGRLL